MPNVISPTPIDRKSIMIGDYVQIFIVTLPWLTSNDGRYITTDSIASPNYEPCLSVDSTDPHKRYVYNYTKNTLIVIDLTNIYNHLYNDVRLEAKVLNVEKYYKLIDWMISNCRILKKRNY